jgi:hypothetical protein
MPTMRVLVFVAVGLVTMFGGARQVRAQATASAPATRNAPATTRAVSTTRSGPTTKSAAAQPLQGNVVSIGPSSFSIKDKNNAVVTVKFDLKTTFTLDDKKSTFLQAVNLGYTIRATLNASGIATDVIAKSNQPTSQPSQMEQLKKALQVKDDEWLVMRPRIEKVQSLQAKLDNLERAVTVKNLPTVKGNSDQIKADLAAKREARAKLSAELEQARKELINILTLPQEMQLFQMGIVK